jgi:hypothetical protein
MTSYGISREQGVPWSAYPNLGYPVRGYDHVAIVGEKDFRDTSPSADPVEPPTRAPLAQCPTGAIEALRPDPL